VSSNGHLTFGAGSVTYTANPANFFGMKMIAPYFVDLNPSVGGNVYKEMLADRAVISYVAVPYYPATYSVTFQVELVFATGAISFTYGTMVVPSSSAVSSRPLEPEWPFGTYPSHRSRANSRNRFNQSVRGGSPCLNAVEKPPGELACGSFGLCRAVS